MEIQFIEYIENTNGKKLLYKGSKDCLIPPKGDLIILNNSTYQVLSVEHLMGISSDATIHQVEITVNLIKLC